MNHPNKTVCWNFRDCFWTVRGLSFGLSKCPCVPLIGVVAKINNSIGCLAPKEMSGCNLNQGKLPFFLSYALIGP